MPQQAIDRKLEATFESIRHRHPVYNQIIDKFQNLFHTQAELKKEFSGIEFNWKAPDPARMEQGVAVLADQRLPECSEQLHRSCLNIAPVIAKSFSMDKDMDRLIQAAKSDTVDLYALTGALLDENPRAFEKAAQDLGTDPAVLVFAMRLIASPVLAAMALDLAPGLENISWTQGYCPICGQPPMVASLSRFENKRNEELVGGGGKKKLFCGLCSHEWNFRRDACPACGETDHHKRELIFAEDKKFERIEACNSCGTYMLCVDLRELDLDPAMQAMPLGLIHLDMIAKEKKLSPLTATPWNIAQDREGD